MKWLIFEDKYSLVHALLGFLAGIGDSVAITLLFVGYQLAEKEKERRKLGDFIEYGVGFAAGYVFRLISHIYM